MDRIKDETIRLWRPDLADVLVWLEAAEGLSSAREGVSRDEVADVCSELFVAVVMDMFDGRLRDRAVHPLDLALFRGWFGWSGGGHTT